MPVSVSLKIVLVKSLGALVAGNSILTAVPLNNVYNTGHLVRTVVPPHTSQLIQTDTNWMHLNLIQF